VSGLQITNRLQERIEKAERLLAAYQRGNPPEGWVKRLWRIYLNGRMRSIIFDITVEFGRIKHAHGESLNDCVIKRSSTDK
jgi:hypothetical protein